LHRRVWSVSILGFIRGGRLIYIQRLEVFASFALSAPLAELNLGRARLDEVEVDKVLDFAENLLLNTAEA
jgi:hypothetical protein